MAKKGGDPTRGGDPTTKSVAANIKKPDAAKKGTGGEDKRTYAIAVALEAALLTARKADAAAKKTGQDFLVRGNIGSIIGTLRKEYGEDAVNELMQGLEQAGIKNRKASEKIASPTVLPPPERKPISDTPEPLSDGVQAGHETEDGKVELIILTEKVKRSDPNDPSKGTVEIEAKTADGKVIRRSLKLNELGIKKPEIRTANDGYLLMLARKKLDDELGGVEFMVSSLATPPPKNAREIVTPTGSREGTSLQPVDQKPHPIPTRALGGQIRQREGQQLKEGDNTVKYLEAQISFSIGQLENSYAIEKKLILRKTSLTKKDTLSPQATAELMRIEDELLRFNLEIPKIKITLDRTLSRYGAIKLDEDARIARIREDIGLLEKKDTLTESEQAAKQSFEKEISLQETRIAKMEKFTNDIDTRLRVMYPALNFQRTSRAPEVPSPDKEKFALTDAQIEKLRTDYKTALESELALLKDINATKKKKDELTHTINQLPAGKEKTKAITALKSIERELARLESDLEKYGKKRSSAADALTAAGISTITYQRRDVVDDEMPENIRAQGIMKDISQRKATIATKYHEMGQTILTIDRAKLSVEQKQHVVSLLRAAKETFTYVQSPPLKHETVSDTVTLNKINNTLTPLQDAITNAAIEIEKLARQYPLLRTGDAVARGEIEKKPPAGYFHNRYAVASEDMSMGIYRIISDISQNQFESLARLGKDTTEYFYIENPKAQLSHSPWLPQGLDAVERFELAKLLRRDGDTFLKSDESLAAIPSRIKDSAKSDTYAVFFYTIDGAKNSLTIHFPTIDTDGAVMSTQTFFFDDPKNIQADDIRIVLNRIPLKTGEKYNIAALLDDKTLSDVLLSAVREHCKDTIVRNLFDVKHVHYIGAMHALPNVREHQKMKAEQEAAEKARREYVEKLAHAPISYRVGDDGGIERLITVPTGEMHIDHVDTSAFPDEIDSELICKTLKEEEEKIRTFFYTTSLGGRVPGGFLDVRPHEISMVVPHYKKASDGNERITITFNPLLDPEIKAIIPFSDEQWAAVAAGTKKLTDLSQKQREKILDAISEKGIRDLAKYEALARLLPETPKIQASAKGKAFMDAALDTKEPSIHYMEERNALKQELQQASETIREMAADRETQQTVGKKIFKDILTTISNLMGRIEALEESASRPQEVRAIENAPTHEEIAGILQLINNVRGELQDKARQREERMRAIRERLANIKGNESINE
ncbi:hypothetical protein HY621_00725 [Candidatus Uhrbacteria bacterium]|nr:hypothetical protein [Candidatus Uhrbacteria bacterium]